MVIPFVITERLGLLATVYTRGPIQVAAQINAYLQCFFTLISFQPLKSEEAIIQASNEIGFNYKILINTIVLVKCS